MIDADAVHVTDTDGADILTQMARELRPRGASLALAQVHPPVLALWRRAGLMDVIGDDAVFETVRDAVDAVTPCRRPRPLARRAQASPQGGHTCGADPVSFGYSWLAAASERSAEADAEG